MAKKHLQAKKNHHYVWANYMTRWSNGEKQVWHTTQTGKICQQSVRNISKEQYFYKVGRLTPEHVELIKAWSSQSPEDLHKIHMQYLSDYLLYQKLESIYENSGIKDKETDKLFHAMECNGIENYHSSHENEVKKILDELSQGNMDILNDNENMLEFSNFYGHQITRTKTFKDSSLSPQKSIIENHALGRKLLQLTDECWWFISYILGMNIGRSIYLERKEDNHCLLINNTTTPFITSDQPVINVHNDLDDNNISSPEHHQCDFYYPISPTSAYMINKSNRFSCGVSYVTEEVAQEMNIKMAKRANIHIIGDSKESLLPYKKYVGERMSLINKNRL